MMGTHQLLFNAYSEEEMKLGVDPTFAAGLGKPQTMDGYLLSYKTAQQISEKLDVQGFASFDWNRRVFPRNQDISQASGIVGWRASGEAKGQYALTSAISAELGIDYDNRKSVQYRNYNTVLDSTLTQSNLLGRGVYEYSIFGQLGFDEDKFNIVAVGRYTKNEFFGDNFSGRGTIVFSIDEKNSIKLIAGQSFRAPSMFEVFFLTPSKSVSGLLNIKPETSNDIELAYLTSFGPVFVQALGYYAEYENKIFRVSKPFAVTPDGTIGGANTKQYFNGAKFTAQGLEIEAKYHTSVMRFFFKPLDTVACQ